MLPYRTASSFPGHVRSFQACTRAAVLTASFQPASQSAARQAHGWLKLLPFGRRRVVFFGVKATMLISMRFTSPSRNVSLITMLTESGIGGPRTALERQV